LIRRINIEFESKPKSKSKFEVKLKLESKLKSKPKLAGSSYVGAYLTEAAQQQRRFHRGAAPCTAGRLIEGVQLTPELPGNFLNSCCTPAEKNVCSGDHPLLNKTALQTLSSHCAPSSSRTSLPQTTILILHTTVSAR